MEIIPNSTLYLCKNVDLDPNYNYTIDFDDNDEQDDYFDSKIVNDFEPNEDYSYVRDTRAIKVPANINDLLDVNYLFFNNGNKRYYAFIIHKDYVHSNCTSLQFKIDVLQSFMFDYEIDESFIDREHQDRFKKVGSHYEPIYNIEAENLDIGNEYNETRSTIPNDDAILLITAKEPLATGDLPTVVEYTVSTGVYQYLALNPLKYSVATVVTGGTSSSKLLALPQNIVEDSKVINIRYLGYVPNFITISGGAVTVNIPVGSANIINYTTNESLIHIGRGLASYLNKDITIGDDNEAFYYQPNIENLKRKSLETKLKVYPYAYKKIYSGGNSSIVKNENIKFTYNGTSVKSSTLKCKLSLSSTGATNLHYVENDNSKINNDVVGKQLNVTLRTDAWQNYVMNNKASVDGGLAVGVVGALAGIALGIATGGVGLAVAGAGAIAIGTQVANTMMKQQDIKDSPDQVKSGDDVNTLHDLKMFIGIGKVEITDNYKEKLFNYFYHYGYKCNDFKKPNTRSRYYFNYIKTIGANIKGNIDSEFKTNIMEIYDRGLTIWHYRDSLTFKGVNNYNYENVEINLMEV